MGTTLNPYLSFRGNAREAMDFYQSVFGGEVEHTTFGEANASEDPAEQDKIMHSSLRTDDGLNLMASDTPDTMELATGSSIQISLSGDDDAELRGYWDRLAEDGQVTVPLETAPWGDAFGMLTDRFGTAWMVNIAGSTGSA